MDDTESLLDRLVGASIVVESEDDFDLADDFRRNWRGRIARLSEQDSSEYLALLLDVDPAALSFRERDDGAMVAETDAGPVGTWPSEPALTADIAAFVTLQEWFPEWEELTGEARDELIARLRFFLETCPACDGDLSRDYGTGPEGIPRVFCPDCEIDLL